MSDFPFSAWNPHQAWALPFHGGDLGAWQSFLVWLKVPRPKANGAMICQLAF